MLVHQNIVFFPCPSFPSRRCQWHFFAFPTEHGTQGLKPELHKPTSWGLLVVRERLERSKFQVAFLATTHSSFGGRTLLIWLPSAVPSFSGKICPDHQPLVYLFLLQKIIYINKRFDDSMPILRCTVPALGRVSVTTIQKPCKDHSLSLVCAAVIVEKA